MVDDTRDIFIALENCLSVQFSSEFLIAGLSFQWNHSFSIGRERPELGPEAT